MKFIATAADVARLDAEADSWVKAGTPYAPGGIAIKGAGTSCQHLPAEILINLGWTCPRPPARGLTESEKTLGEMLAWAEAHERWLKPVEIGAMTPGCVLFLNLFGVGHACLVVSGNNAVHCWPTGGVQYKAYRPQTVWRTIAAVFEPQV